MGTVLRGDTVREDTKHPNRRARVGAGRDALSSAAGVLREEAAQADLGAKVSDLADKVVQGVTNGSSKS